MQKLKQVRGRSWIAVVAGVSILIQAAVSSPAAFGKIFFPFKSEAEKKAMEAEIKRCRLSADLFSKRMEVHAKGSKAAYIDATRDMHPVVRASVSKYCQKKRGWTAEKEANSLDPLDRTFCYAEALGLMEAEAFAANTEDDSEENVLKNLKADKSFIAPILESICGAKPSMGCFDANTSALHQQLVDAYNEMTASYDELARWSALAAACHERVGAQKCKNARAWTADDFMPKDAAKIEYAPVAQLPGRDGEYIEREGLAVKPSRVYKSVRSSGKKSDAGKSAQKTTAQATDVATASKDSKVKGDSKTPGKDKGEGKGQGNGQGNGKGDGKGNGGKTDTGASDPQGVTSSSVVPGGTGTNTGATELGKGKDPNAQPGTGTPGGEGKAPSDTPPPVDVPPASELFTAPGAVSSDKPTVGGTASEGADIIDCEGETKKEYEEVAQLNGSGKRGFMLRPGIIGSTQALYFCTVNEKHRDYAKAIFLSRLGMRISHVTNAAAFGLMKYGMSADMEACMDESFQKKLHTELDNALADAKVMQSLDKSKELEALVTGIANFGKQDCGQLVPIFKNGSFPQEFQASVCGWQQTLEDERHNSTTITLSNGVTMDGLSRWIAHCPSLRRVKPAVAPTP